MQNGTIHIARALKKIIFVPNMEIPTPKGSQFGLESNAKKPHVKQMSSRHPFTQKLGLANMSGTWVPTRTSPKLLLSQQFMNCEVYLMQQCTCI
jgi:hypothetical protein